MSANDPFGFAAAINWDVVDARADEIVDIFEKQCAGCGRVNGALGGTDKCVDCVGVDIHNYRALHDGRMKIRSYR